MLTTTDYNRHICYLAPQDGDYEVDWLVSGYTTPGWYFWDETGACCHGPYESREEAKGQLAKYAEWLDGGKGVEGA